MMADIDEEDRYGLFGLCIGLQSKDLALVSENLLKVSGMECMDCSGNVCTYVHHVDCIAGIACQQAQQCGGRGVM